MGETQIYKKFLLQKKILDTLRAFLDLNETLINELHKETIINEQDVNEIQNLQWPKNRNELLLKLVKKSWTQLQLEGFIKSLKLTQHSQITEIMLKEKEKYFKAYEEELHLASQKVTKVNSDKGTSHSNLNNDLDKIFKKKLTVQEENMIRRLLNDRDSEIFQLKIENQELRNQVKETVTENNMIKTKFSSLDKAASDLLACVEWDVDERTLEHGLADLRARLMSVREEVRNLHVQLDSQFTIERNLKERITTLAEDNNSLRQLAASTKENLEKVESFQEDTITELRRLLEEETEHAIKLQKRLELMESRYKSAIVTLQEQITNLKKELRDVISKLKISDEERDKVKHQLNQLNDKTRKLLTSLDLESESKDTSVALDFARSVSYIKRKNTNIAAKRLVIASKSMSISDSQSTITSTKQNSSLPLISEKQSSVLPKEQLDVKGKSNDMLMNGEIIKSQSILSKRKSIENPSFMVKNKETKMPETLS